MAKPVFYLRRKFSKGFIISIRLKHRIVSKPFFSFWLFYDPAVANSFKEISFLHCDKGEHRPESNRADRGEGQLVQKPDDVVCIGVPLSGISGRVNAPSPVQRVYFPAGILRPGMPF